MHLREGTHNEVPQKY